MKKSGYADATKNFLSILAENGRLGDVKSICDAFDQLQRAAKGEVTTSEPFFLGLTPKPRLRNSMEPWQLQDIGKRVPFQDND